LEFDGLIVAAGAVPVQPKIEGLNVNGVFQLHTMEDSFRVKEYLKHAGAASAIIIGAGYIGMEMRTLREAPGGTIRRRVHRRRVHHRRRFLP
jgi:NAD(P)H-nitrite reductase large subunit